MSDDKLFLTSEKFLILNDLTISRLKKRAKAYRKSELSKDISVSQTDALNYIARIENFNSWRDLINIKNDEEEAAGFSYFDLDDEEFRKHDFHTKKQLHGSLYRSLNLPLNSISPVVQVAIPEGCIDVDSRKANLLFFENYLVEDNDLECYLEETTSFFNHRVEAFGEMYFLKLFKPDICTYRQVDEYMHNLIELIGRFDNNANTDFIWINGKSSSYIQNQILADAEGDEDELKSSQSYFTLPDEVWKENLY